jgi:hypothetical protein
MREVETQRSEVGAEEVPERRGGQHQVEQVPEGLWPAGMMLGLIRRNVIMHLDEHDEQIQHDRYTAPVERRAHVARWCLGRAGRDRKCRGAE